jgi:hypothetical protein
MRLKESANKKTKGNCKIQGMINSCQILKKNIKKYNVEKENSSQFGVT